MTSSTLGGVELSLFSSRVQAICDEMGVALRRSAFSPNIKDRLDFSCALFDATGALFGQAAHIPVHLGSMAYAMADIVKRFEWKADDLVLLNDPFLGGTHLPDVTAVCPIFHERCADRIRGVPRASRQHRFGSARFDAGFHVARRRRHRDRADAGATRRRADRRGAFVVRRIVGTRASNGGRVSQRRTSRRFFRADERVPSRCEARVISGGPDGRGSVLRCGACAERLRAADRARRDSCDSGW